MIGRNIHDAISGIAMLLFLAAVAFIVASVLHGCASMGVADRAHARGAVIAGAEAVKAADQLCADVALTRRDAELAERCSRSYTFARAGLLITAHAVDHWDDPTARQSVACASRSVVQALNAISHELKAVSAPVPPIVDDALALAPLLGVCPDNVPAPGGQ